MHAASVQVQPLCQTLYRGHVAHSVQRTTCSVHRVRMCPMARYDSDDSIDSTLRVTRETARCCNAALLLSQQALHNAMVFELVFSFQKDPPVSWEEASAPLLRYDP